jgi:hypothetical protein
VKARRITDREFNNFPRQVTLHTTTLVQSRIGGFAMHTAIAMGLMWGLVAAVAVAVILL